MITPYRVLVTGSRTWPTPGAVWSALNDARDKAFLDGRRLVVVHGACPRGADQHVADWCATANSFADSITEEAHPAAWALEGKRAGFIRNARMVNFGADTCLAFIAGGSRGASHTARLAEEAGIPVRRWTA